VLVAGGSDGSSYALSTSLIYDHGSNSWSNGPSFFYARRSPASVLLADGRVMISGGDSSATPGTTGSSYAYNPSTNGWDSTGSHTARTRHSLVRLADGRVAALGDVTTVDVWNKASTWTATGSLGTAREYAMAALLPSGKVLVAGGDVPYPGSGYLASAEIWDPATGVSTPIVSMSQARSGGRATPLPDGRILVTGGIYASGSYTATAEIFDEATGTWTSAGYGGSRWLHGAVKLPSGAVLVAGGYGNTSAQLFQVLAKGADCSEDYECASRHCVDGVCCDTTCSEQCKACNMASSKGTCSAVTGAPVGGRADCGAYVCTAGACATGCTSDAQCAATNWCKGTACVTKTADGGACGGAHECASGHCIDGVCCGTACTEQCFACAEPGHVGVCTQIGGAPRGGRTPCPSGWVCGVTAVCVDASTGPKTLGSPCTATSECPSGTYCTDGVCCGQSICAAGSACNLTGKGNCAQLPGTKCTSDLECGAGHCADGVCCDRACLGQCEACDVPGTVGTCAPVIGAPRGGRAACGVDAVEPCKSRACDGVTRDTCATYVGTGTSCGAASCAGATLTPAPACDGKGSCAVSAARSCAPYACSAGACLAACAHETDCAPGFTCRDNSCVPSGATCTDDLTASVDQKGNVTPCAPFRCVASGVCATECGSTNDCASGATCETSSRLCVGTAASGDQGGCASAPANGGDGGAGVAGVAGAIAILAAVVARRRRAR
jgi:hypothetical protein